MQDACQLQAVIEETVCHLQALSAYCAKAVPVTTTINVMQ
jgi:hypothetical protein